MNIIKVPLSELRQPERNIRMHTETQLREFERSITMFGQIRPLVVDESNVILAGNGCYETLVRMGRSEADVYKICGLTDAQKKKLMIADNKVYSLGIDDLDTFNAFLEDLRGDLDIPGFDEDLLKSMVAEAEEVTDKIERYGVIGQDEADGIRAAAARKDALMEKAAQPPEQPAPAPAPAEPAATAPPISGQPTPEPAPVRKSIVCPKCGETIWL